MPHQWTEHPNSRQATKNDLVDIANALGVDMTRQASYSVVTLRALIRAKLDASKSPTPPRGWEWQAKP